MGRHLLDPVGNEPVAGVVRRLGAVLASDEGAAELAVRARRAGSRRGEVELALAQGRLVKVAAFRGAVHYLSAEDGGAYLALRAAGRQWQLPSWRRHHGLEPHDWPRFRGAVREALADGPLTLDELRAAVGRADRRLHGVFDGGAATLVKPLMWQGDTGYGPSREGRPTFRRLGDSPHWAGIWDLEDAGPYAVSAYLRSYGPATRAHIHYWLGEGLSAGRARLDSWLAGMTDRLHAVDVEGETAYVLDEDVDDLLAARPSTAVRLLPGHDQWVLGPGTKDEHVVPAAHRTPVTRRANLVLAGGVVSGTWTATAGELRTTWFAQRGRPPREDLEEQASKVAVLLDRPLTPTVEIG
jgi:hypothetical protein